MKTRTALLALSGLAATLLLGCSGRGTPATPTPSSSATVAASPSGTPTPSPTPTLALPTATSGAAIPAVVTQVIAAVTARDAASLLALVEYQQVGCTTAQGAGGPPKCRPGDPQGTVYRRFPSGVCEGEWAEDASSPINQLVTSVGSLYAAAAITPPTSDPEPYWPRGETVVMFRAGGNGGPGGYFILAKDRIVRAHFLCDRGAGTEDRVLKDLHATSYLIAPVLRAGS